MRRSATILFLCVACLFDAAASAQPAPAPATGAFDGTWFVSLDCDDTSDQRGLVKGYRFAFDAEVKNGHLDGRYGAAGAPSSLHLAGDVREGGVLELRAEGMTGSNEYVVGRAARGTPYVYTMTGRLDGPRGEATRRELRPCRALFVKKDAAAR